MLKTVLHIDLCHYLIFLFLHIKMLNFFEHVFILKIDVPHVVPKVVPGHVNLPTSRSSVAELVTGPRRSKRQRTKTSFAPDFVASFLVEVLESFDADALIDDFVSLVLFEEYLKTYQEIMRLIDATFWKETIKSEIDSLESNKTWELTYLPKGCKPISSK